MEQDNILSCAPQSSVSENREYVNYYHSMPSTSSSYHSMPSTSNSYHSMPSTSSSSNCYPNADYVREDYSSSLSTYERVASSSYQNSDYDPETECAEPSQALALCEGAVGEGASHEGVSQDGASHGDALDDDGYCDCDSDSDSDWSSDSSEDREILGEIVDELFEEIIIEHCFQVHQAKKLGALIFEEAVEETNQEPKDTPTSGSVTCPNCFNKHDLKHYKQKLGECMRVKTRSSKRITRAQNSFAEAPIENFPSSGPSKSKKRRQQSKKGASKSSKVRLLEDDGDIYSKEACGHVTKSGNRCTKKGNCPTHKPQTKSTMPVLDYSYNIRPQPSFQDEYDTIDVDTVEETTPHPSFSSYNPPNYSSHEFSNSLVTRSEENGKIKVIIKSDPQKKKKKKKSKKESYSYPI